MIENNKIINVYRKNTKRSGFSLVEVIIVISIMALLAITVLGGRSLIAVAKIQSVINHLNTYEQGVFNFYLQYNYLPGDFPNPEVWLENDIRNTCNKVDETYKPTSDKIDRDFIRGDGDGYVATEWTGQQTITPEADIANCHLALSNYLPLKKLGRGVRTNASSSYKWTTLSGNLKNDLLHITGYWIDNKNRLRLYSNLVDKVKLTKDSLWPSGNFIILDGKNKHGLSNWPSSTHVNSYILSSIDKKIDDGKPGLGKIKFHIEYSNTKQHVIENNKIICTRGEVTFTYHTCGTTSEFQNISYSNTDSGILIYQPKWLYDLTE